MILRTNTGAPAAFTCLECAKHGADFDMNGLKFCDEQCAHKWLNEDEEPADWDEITGGGAE